MKMPRVTLTSLDSKLDSLAETVEKIDHTVNGNGKEGLKTLVDRLVQIEASRKWVIRALVTSVLSLMTAVIGGASLFYINSIGG